MNANATATETIHILDVIGRMVVLPGRSGMTRECIAVKSSPVYGPCGWALVLAEPGGRGTTAFYPLTVDAILVAA